MGGSLVSVVCLGLAIIGHDHPGRTNWGYVFGIAAFLGGLLVASYRVWKRERLALLEERGTIRLLSRRLASERKASARVRVRDLRVEAFMAMIEKLSEGQKRDLARLVIRGQSEEIESLGWLVTDTDLVVRQGGVLRIVEGLVPAAEDWAADWVQSITISGPSASR